MRRQFKIPPQFQRLVNAFALSNNLSWAADRQLLLATLLGGLVSLILFQINSGSQSVHVRTSTTLVVLVFVSPLFEELLFRGFLQGYLLEHNWGKLSRFGLTLANFTTTIFFTLFHFINHPPVWAASVLVPSLLFGYFRDRHNSVYPSITLHAFYNGCYFFLPILLGPG
jgi:membrane protease YdiL (CAAX protease family)